MDATTLNVITQSGSFALIVYLFLTIVLKLAPAFLQTLKETQAGFQTQLREIEVDRKAQAKELAAELAALRGEVQELNGRIDQGVCEHPACEARRSGQG